MNPPKNDEGPRANRGHSPHSGPSHDQYTTHFRHAQVEPSAPVDLLNTLGDEWGAPWFVPVSWYRVPPMRLVPWGGNFDYFARHREILADFHSFNLTRTQVHLHTAMRSMPNGVTLGFNTPVLGASFFLLEPTDPSYFDKPTDALYAVCITYVVRGALRIFTVAELSDEHDCLADEDTPARAMLYVGWGCPAPLQAVEGSTR